VLPLHSIVASILQDVVNEQLKKIKTSYQPEHGEKSIVKWRQIKVITEPWIKPTRSACLVVDEVDLRLGCHGLFPSVRQGPNPSAISNSWRRCDSCQNLSMLSLAWVLPCRGSCDVAIRNWSFTNGNRCRVEAI